MASDVVLETRGLRKDFGGLSAVDGVDLDVRKGTLTGIIGPNGAGKSTFFNLLAGYLKPSGGTVRHLGVDITGFPPHKVARRGIARTFQITRPLARLTVTENMVLAQPGQSGERPWMPLLAYPAVKAEEASIVEKARGLLDRFGLAPVADEYAGALSGGQKKLLEMARGLMLDPTLMLLDEPLAGVNPTLGKRIMDLVDDLRRERGITFILVEHDLDVVFTRCDPVVVMAAGKKMTEGSPDVVRRDPRVVEAYIGG
jgi:branched-chain amino acid transport system ATP-binding protein